MTLYADVWPPEVEDEYYALLEAGRDIGADVGNQFRAFMRLLDVGLVNDWRPIDRAGRADIYVMYGRYALLFFAVTREQMAIVKWAELGTPHQQSQARKEAVERTLRLFP